MLLRAYDPVWLVGSQSDWAMVCDGGLVGPWGGGGEQKGTVNISTLQDLPGHSVHHEPWQNLHLWKKSSYGNKYQYQNTNNVLSIRGSFDVEMKYLINLHRYKSV